MNVQVACSKEKENILTILAGEDEKEMDENTKVILKLEERNFHVDSAGWEKIWRGWLGQKSFLMNPEGDICEFLHGKFKGEQLFSWRAARRETRRAGKFMPNSDEWEIYGLSIPNIVFAGRHCIKVCCGYSVDRVFEDQGNRAYFWCDDDLNVPHWHRLSREAYSYEIGLIGLNGSSSVATPKSYAQSVRCFEKK
jgi:hypothetical protein